MKVDINKRTGRVKDMRKIIAGITAIAMMACCSCGVKARQDKPLKIYKENGHSETIGTYKVVDLDTGVNYVVVWTHRGVAICPRYNADGSLYKEDAE